MGNQLEREHDVGPVVATGGPDGIWKIYTAKKKDTGEPVSIWVFEKKQLEKHPRDVQEAVLAMLRADMTNLSRLVHPNVVRVLQPLMETRALLVAQTEPIFASLANVLRDFSGLPKVPSALENFELDPLEAKLGLLELAEGLAFLHGHARIVHRNVCPESIFLTQKGMWKLGGFHFGLFLSSRQAGETMRLDYREFDYKPPFRVSPNLDYMAPEAASGKWEPSSDMWSLGMVAWQLHTRKPPPSTRNNLLTHRAVVERIRSMDWTQFPDALQAPLARMLSEQPHSRPDVRTFLESPYFKDTLLLALVFLNDLITKDHPSKLKFFKGLASVLPRFPPRLIKEKVVAALLAELGRSEGELQALVLQSVLASSRGTLTASEFSRLVLPSLLPLITPEAPMPCLLLLLGELETLAKLAPPDDVSQYLVPLVVRALESPNPKLNEEALKQLPKAVRVFDVAAVRDVVVPRLELLMANTRLEPIRARILITLKDVVEIVDKSTVSDRVLAIVDTCLAIDRSAPTLMRCIVVYDLISEKVGMEITAARILPFVVPLLLEPQLGAQQIAFVLERIKSMLERVGEARLKRLAAATEPKVETTTLTTEAEFEAVVASEGVKKAADRTRSHGTPPASISSYPTSSIITPSSAFNEGSLMHAAQSSSAPFQTITMPASSYNFPSHPTSANGLQQRLLPTAAPSAARPALADAPSVLPAPRPFPGLQSPAGLDSHHNRLSAPQASLLQHSPLHTHPAAQLPTTASHPQLPSATSPATTFSFPPPPRAGPVSASMPQPASPSPLFGLTPPPSHQPAPPPQGSGMLTPSHMNLQPPKPHHGGQPGFSPPPSGARPPVDNATSLL